MPALGAAQGEYQLTCVRGARFTFSYFK